MSNIHQNRGDAAQVSVPSHGVIQASSQHTDFLLQGSPADIANYARAGDDLVLTTQDGRMTRINGFFAHGANFNHVVFVNGPHMQLADFSAALTSQGDGVTDTLVTFSDYQADTAANATASAATGNSSLLSILGGGALLAAAAGGAAGGGGGGGSTSASADTTQSAQPVSPASYADDVGAERNLYSTASRTDDPQPGLNIGAELTSTPTLYVNGKEVASTYDPTTGTLTPNAPLTDGTYDFSYTLTNAAGKQSALSGVLTVTIDTTSPATLTVALANDTGVSASDNITADGTLKVTGLTAGDTAEYSTDGGQTWSDSFTTTGMSDGNITVLVREIDGSGNTSASTEFSFTLDTHANAPTVEVTPDSNGQTSDSTPTFSGSADKDAQVSLVIDGGAAITVTAADNSQWSYTPYAALANGQHTVSVTETDLAGNVSTEHGSASFTVNATVTTSGSTPDSGSGDTSSSGTSGGTSDDGVAGSATNATAEVVSADNAIQSLLFIDNGLPDARWNDGSPVGTPVTVTYSFVNGDESWSATLENVIKNVFASISDFANITFQEVNSGGEIGFSLNSQVAGYFNTAAATPPEIRSGYDSPTAEVAFYYDLSDSSNLATDAAPGSYFYFTALHEIGHALGLNHPFDGPNYTLESDLDNNDYTVMSYTRTQTSTYDSSYQQYDIEALQYLYGANTSTNSGDTTYSWPTGGGTELRDTVWDGGGNDTFDFSNQTTNTVINLQAGAFSYILNAYNYPDDKIAIAPGVVIENAIGGSGNDTIYGNDANNHLQGGAGDDILYGSLGNDLLQGGAGDDTYMLNSSDLQKGAVTVIDDDGGAIFIDNQNLASSNFQAVTSNTWSSGAITATLTSSTLTLNLAGASGHVEIDNFAPGHYSLNLPQLADLLSSTAISTQSAPAADLSGYLSTTPQSSSAASSTSADTSTADTTDITPATLTSADTTTQLDHSQIVV